MDIVSRTIRRGTDVGSVRSAEPQELTPSPLPYEPITVIVSKSQDFTLRFLFDDMNLWTVVAPDWSHPRRMMILWTCVVPCLRAARRMRNTMLVICGSPLQRQHGCRSDLPLAVHLRLVSSHFAPPGSTRRGTSTLQVPRTLPPPMCAVETSSGLPRCCEWFSVGSARLRP
ncbi:hypothetical protein PHLGIDRAFT_372857 [Phlebiopsis gigantea 11061_1 CR5-6]|uniref:Uncharacterized protein n=1 Tax=Phlebiopsis gigantea (strain 11061_1 CR5-6) TaxID=745531 RepID=A0A0C3SC77_PHLG1|nr:hypothetical protein PHLGIDRAFT_372857 [Phlebiopsis gigantea 11061_1 CR5-6]